MGLRPIDKDARIRAGAHLVPKDAEPIARNDQGYVTSIAYSPSLGHWLGLGLIARGPERHGEVVRACDPLRGSDIEVEICASLFRRSGRSAPPCLVRSNPSQALPAWPRPAATASAMAVRASPSVERIGLGLATVAARKGQARALQDRVREAYGVDLPQTSRVVVGRDVSFVGYGPGQWLAVSETLASEALARDLAERLKGLASISDQSSGRTVIRVSGPRARDVLAKGLPIDLDPRAFPPR